MQRRTFIGLAVGAIYCAATRGRSTGSFGHFTIGRFGDRFLLASPDGQPFFSLGLNHLDSSPLRALDNGAIWRERYGNSMERWLRERVQADLRNWGFNSVGWVQDVVVSNSQIHGQSRNFTPEEYRWLGMPFCHLLPFSGISHWEKQLPLPDIRSPAFAEWCDYVARDECARFADDPNLIGYFYSDCPVWVHSHPNSRARGPLFDPQRLASESGRTELFELATIYYRTTRQAIRRYDPHHLILGDRYEANAHLPEEVVRAALPHVDALSFQCFGGAPRVQEKLGHWARLTGHPILLADSATYREPYVRGYPPKQDRFIDSIGYREILDVLQRMPQAIGFHLCGAYIRSSVRRSGLLAPDETPDSAAIDGIRTANHEIAAWVGLHRR